MKKQVFVMLVGLPSSGKSTWIKDNISKTVKGESVIISPDAIRKELGCMNDKTRNTEEIVQSRINSALLDGYNVFYDDTNINRKRRVNFLKEVRKITSSILCILMATPIEICLERNSSRDRCVPENVIISMYKKFNIPSKDEGFEKVSVVYPPHVEYSKNYGPFDDWYEKYKEFNQDNPYHKLTLGDHCKIAGEYITNNYPGSRNSEDYRTLILAALFHDCAKFRVKDFRNGKGEITEVAHYFGHDKASAYDSLFYTTSQDFLYIALLIEYHMTPFLQWKQSAKSKEKDRRLFGDKFINDVEMLHEADLYAM